ncbi:MAG: multicopper oxidase family protein [Prochlorococcus sp.]
MDFSYLIGGLFPRIQEGPDKGKPNVISSSSLSFDAKTNTITATEEPGQLEAYFKITTNSIVVPGVDEFLEGWLLDGFSSDVKGIGGLTDKKSPTSLFNQYLKVILGQWTRTPLNELMKLLEVVGYSGSGHDKGGDTSAEFRQLGIASDDNPYYKAASEQKEGIYVNYDPIEKWLPYMQKIDTKDALVVSSSYDMEALYANLEAMASNHDGHEMSHGTSQDMSGEMTEDGMDSPPLWYPSLLYTYGSSNQNLALERTNFPGPVLMMQPGEDLVLHFDNAISLPGLNEEQNALAGFVPNSTYGSGGSEGLGAGTSTNIHVHGSHTTSGGFGDNVISRYTTGQRWTSTLSLPEDHGLGAYWYHPHYHPSVNQQVFGGLSGALAIGDPLAKVPGLEDIPRNLAVMKTMDLDVDQSGNLQASSFGSLGGPFTNQLRMVTVNGEFKPISTNDQGGWQSITLSNQSNQAFYNIQLVHTEGSSSTTLPIWIYGEDGHQYPQIRRAKGTLAGNSNKAPTEYSQKRDLVALAPGKRVDILAYLPAGETQLSSIYKFQNKKTQFYITNSGLYPDLIEPTDEVKYEATQASAGAMALFDVSASTPPLTRSEQKSFIAEVNQGIQIQDIKPTTKSRDYQSAKVPSVNLFKKKKNGEDRWNPARKRQFSWAKNTLVSKPREWDPPTQIELEKEQRDYKRFRPLVDLSKKGGGFLSVDGKIEKDWLGYTQPFLINDHVFPNAPLVVSQLGTIEEWQLLDWSVSFPWKYAAHPFHIHINDYQVEDSDTELLKKRSLEDVTMVNASGYHYWDNSKPKDSPDAIVKQPPFRGKFIPIDEAFSVGYDPTKGPTQELATFGASSQNVRMLFQDYTGTYVFHCHILPHEDAGMMQAITVIDNTDSSWLVPADYLQAEHGLDGKWKASVYLADSFEPAELVWNALSGQIPVRGQSADLTGDFIQDILISSEGKGHVSIFDGSSLLERGETKLLARFNPYKKSQLAPWAFMEDVTGDQVRDLLTAGFARSDAQAVQLEDLRLKGWKSTDDALSWSEIFDFDPFDFIAIDAEGVRPLQDLGAHQVSVNSGDFNLDNFVDVAIAYRTESGVRVSILDGAALSLTLQTNTFEGGYFPDKALLADAVINHPAVKDAAKISLTSGFNQYGQIALENLLLTVPRNKRKTDVLSLQLEAGHFIATDLDPDDASHQPSGHHGSSMIYEGDEYVDNLPSNQGFPMHLIDTHSVKAATIAPVGVTPVFAAADANPGLFLSGLQGGDRFVIAQGNGFNGVDRTSSDLLKSADQLPILIEQVTDVTFDDVTGLSNETPQNLNERFNVVNTVLATYKGKIAKPGQAARWVGLAFEQDQLTTKEFVDAYLNTNQGSKSTASHYKGALESNSTSKIVKITSDTIWGRKPTSKEQQFWKREVSSGLSKTDLPLAMLQSSEGADLNRVAFVSAASAWSHAQWGINAAIQGSRGLGLSNDRPTFNLISDQILDQGTFMTLADAADSFSHQSQDWLRLLSGTEVSDSGFF